jgi:hypothetical protein
MLDPLTDPRWPVFLERNADASIFHTPGWLEALRRTYSYEPVVYTTCPPGEELTNGIPFCRVESWVTGRRFVSLPFSDHCVPLVDTRETLCTLLAAAAHDSIGQGGKYVEIRPLSGDVVGNLLQHNSFGKSSSFYFHWIDLTPSIDEIYATFHRTSVKQMIRRAEKEGLTYNQGTSNELLAQFYHLFRGRYALLPRTSSQWWRLLLVPWEVRTSTSTEAQIHSLQILAERLCLYGRLSRTRRNKVPIGLIWGVVISRIQA